MADLSIPGLRVVRAVAELGSFTAAARTLGYTQSAVSRQIAATEAAAGQALFVRSRSGVTLTAAGQRVLELATRVLGEVDAAQRDLAGEPPAVGPVRLGAFTSAVADLVPRALQALRRAHPELAVPVREGTTPGLVRSLRAGTLDLVVLAGVPPYRPYDAETPPLDLEVISETDLPILVGPTHRFAGRDAVDVAELAGETWVVSRSDGPETLLGVWPGLPGRPHVAYTVRDWLGKAGPVAAGLAITTWPRVAASAAPAGTHLVDVTGGANERRRTVIARLPGAARPETQLVAAALRAAATAGATDLSR